MFITTLTLLLAQPMPLPLEDKQVTVSAQMTDEELVVGEPLAFVVSYSLAETLSASDSGVPSPILQLDLPPSVQLAGKTLVTYDELAANEFLSAPHERLLEKSESRIEFQLIAEPKPGATIGVIVLAYISGAKDEAPTFLRRRLELPLESSAQSTPGDDRNSHWGIDDKLIQIGDRAADFDLPRADRSTLALEQVLEDQNVLVMTYRAYWWPPCKQQLVELHKIYDSFLAANTMVIVIAQEDEDLASHARMLNVFEPLGPNFEVLADLNRAETLEYDRITSYLIDKQGMVVEIFPMTIHGRAGWGPVLREVEKLHSVQSKQGE